MFIALKNAYLCPGDDNGEHITDDPRRCQCGSSNLVLLANILHKQNLTFFAPIMRPYDGICSDLITTMEKYDA